MSGKRHSFVEMERVVREYERSGLTRREFCSARGLKIYTLDAWRQRVRRGSDEAKIVPVELIQARIGACSSVRTKAAEKPSATMRVVLESGLRIEIDPGFDAVGLRRLIAVLEQSNTPASRAE